MRERTRQLYERERNNERKNAGVIERKTIESAHERKINIFIVDILEILKHPLQDFKNIDATCLLGRRMRKVRVGGKGKV